MPSNYGDLKTDVADWIDRDDLVSRVPSFIKMAIHRLNRKLRILDMEELVSTPLSESGQYLELPDRFVLMRNIFIDTSPKPRKLRYVTPAQMVMLNPDDSDPLPAAYTITNRSIKLNKAASTSSNNVIMDYYKGYADLENGSDTNWLLENAYDAMIMGSLVVAEGFLMTDERIPVWKSQFDEIIQELNDTAEEARRSGDDLRIRAT